MKSRSRTSRRPQAARGAGGVGIKFTAKRVPRAEVRSDMRQALGLDSTGMQLDAVRSQAAALALQRHTQSELENAQ